VLQRGAERRKRDFWCLSVARKGEKEIFGASAWRGKIKIEKNHASERLRNTKEESLNDFFCLFCFYTKKCHVNHTAFLSLKYNQFVSNRF